MMGKERQDRHGKNNPMYGRRHSQEAIAKMKQSAKQRYAKINGLLANNNAIAFIIHKGLYEEYTTWVKDIVEKKFNLNNE